MLPSKKVTVISVVHNCSRLLTGALKSFAYQDYENMEWIIVNDASTDNTASKLQRFRKKDPRVRLFLNMSYKGFEDSFEFALSKATGDYIAFLFPEDVWVKNKISRQVGFMMRYDAVLSHTSYTFIDDRYNLLPIGCADIAQRINLLNYGKDAEICLSTFMMNREEIMDVFPMQNLNNEEHPDILTYLMQKGFISQGMTDVLTLCRPIYDYPRRDKAVSQIKHIYEEVRTNNMNVPSLMRYQAYRASNVVGKKLKPSTVIGRDIPASLNELKIMKL